MRAPRLKGVTRITTVERTTEHRFEFTSADLRRLLRLPDDAQLLVEQYQGDGIEREVKQALTLDTGSVALIAKVTVHS